MDDIPFWRRIGTRILAFSIVGITLSMLATGLMISSFATRTLKNNITQRNIQIARRAASEIALYIKDSLDQLRSTAEILGTLYDNPFIRDMILENLTINLDKYRDLYLLDENGNIVASSRIEKQAPAQFDPSFVKKTLQEDPYISAVRLSADNLPYVTVALPVQGGGEQERVLLAQLDLRDIWNLIDAISIGDSGGAFLVSQEGLLIAHPDKKKVLRRIEDNHLVAIPQYLPNEGRVIEQDLNGEKSLAVYQLVADTDWILVLQQPIEEAFLPVETVLFRSLLLIAIGIVLASFFSTILSRQVSRPLENLLDGTRRIGEGNLNHRIIHRQHIRRQRRCPRRGAQSRSGNRRDGTVLPAVSVRR